MTTRQHGDSSAGLDGNAAAGLLRELFAVEMTVAIAICEGCGGQSPLGEARLYGGTMGAIFRCPHCETVMMRLSRTKHGYWLDMRGTGKLTVAFAEK